MARTKQVNIRLSDEEYTQIMQKIADSNYTNLAEFTRNLLLNKKVKIFKNNNCTQQLIAAINKIGVNLNQIARYTNSVRATDEQVLHELQQIKTLLQQLTKGEEKEDDN